MGAKELTASLPNLHLLHKFFISYCSRFGHIRSLQTSGASLGAVPLPQSQPPSLLSLSPRASLRPEPLSLWVLPEALSLCSSLCPGSWVSPSWGSAGFSGQSWVLCWSLLFTKV